MRVLTVYLKPTNYCNVGCEHCYLTKEVRADKTKLDKASIRKTALFIKSLMESENKDSVHIIWHGGEPLTLPGHYFNEAGEILDEVLPGHTESIQTSLIPLREEHIPIIQERFCYQVGSSIDFTQRKVKNSVESYQALWLKKVAMARSHGIHVFPGIVPTRNEIDRAGYIIDWLLDNKFDRVNFERYNIYGVHGQPVDWPNNALHAKFLKDLFDETVSRMQRGRPYLYIKQLKAAINGVLFGQQGDRWGGGCQRNFIVIEPDLSINTCPDRTSHDKSFSNIEDGASGFITSESRRRWIRYQEMGHKTRNCLTCEYSSWCRSGCPITPKLSGGECSGYKSFLNHVKKFANLSEDNKELLIAYVHERSIEEVVA